MCSRLTQISPEFKGRYSLRGRLEPAVPSRFDRVHRFDIDGRGDVVLLEDLLEIQPRQAIETIDRDAIALVALVVVAFDATGVFQRRSLLAHLGEKIPPEVRPV